MKDKKNHIEGKSTFLYFLMNTFVLCIIEGLFRESFFLGEWSK